MRKTIILLFLILAFTAKAQEKFDIQGTLYTNNYDGKKLYLKEVDHSIGFIDLDSAIVKNAKFSFGGNLNNMPKVAFIVPAEPTHDLSQTVIVILENGTTEVSINETGNYLTGGPKVTEFQAFYDEQIEISDKIKTARNEYSEEEYEKSLEELRASTYKYIKNNMKNSIGEFFIMDARVILYPYQIFELLGMAKPDFSQSPQAQYLIQDLLNVSLAVGDNYRDITLEDTNGVNISLSDFVGKSKVVLLDFWASWCGPCRKEMPNVVEAYKKYNNKGFEIVGISLDDNRKAWIEAIRSMNMTWPQMSDMRGWDSEAAQLYKVTSIPYTLLIDQEGKVIAINLVGKELNEKLEEIFSQE